MTNDNMLYATTRSYAPGWVAALFVVLCLLEVPLAPVNSAANSVEPQRPISRTLAVLRAQMDDPIASRPLNSKVWLALAIATVMATMAVLGLRQTRRYRDAVLVVDADPASSQAKPEASERDSRRHWPLNPLNVATVALGAVLLLAVGLIAVELAGSNDTARPQVSEEPGLLRRLTGHTGPVQRVCFALDGQRLVSVSGWPGNDNSVRVWDPSTGAELHRIATPGQSGSLAVSRDGRQVLVGADHAILLIDVESGEIKKTMRGQIGGGVSGVAFSADEAHAYAAPFNGIVRRWNLTTGKEVGQFRVDGTWARGVAELPENKLLTANKDGILQIWNIDTRQEEKRINVGPMWLSTMTLVPGSKQVLISAWDIGLWDLETGKKLRTFVGHGSEARETSLSPDGQLLLSAGYDGTVRLWDLASGNFLRIVGTHREWVNSAVFAPDAKSVVSGGGGLKKGEQFVVGADHDIRVWDIAQQAGASPAVQVERSSPWLIATALLSAVALGAIVLPIQLLRRSSAGQSADSAQKAPKPTARSRVLEFSCDNCGNQLKVKPERAGMRFKCAKCGTVATAPS